MFFDRLQSLCEAKSLKISKVASDILGVSSSAATGWKNGAVPNSSVVIKAAEFFDVSADYLLGLDDVPSRRRKDDFTQENTLLLKELQATDPYTRQIVTALLHAVWAVANTKKEPDSENPRGLLSVSGLAVADSPLYEESDGEELISIPAKYLARDLDQNHYFVVRVRRDSMEPDIPEGSHVVVERNIMPAQGDLALISLDDPEYIIRIVHFHSDEIELVSYNESYPATCYPLSAVRSIERIVRVIPSK